MILPNPKNLKSLQVFFRDYGHLKNSDLAILANTSSSTIRRWKRRCNVANYAEGWGSNKAFRPFQGTKASKVEVVVVPPEVWNNRDWFYQKYVVERLGIPLISRMINRDKNIVLCRFERFNIKTRSYAEASKSKNPCCTYEWLYEHYEIYGMSLEKCAALANVNPYTIYNWLAKFKIYIRNHNECMAGERNPGYGKPNNNFCLNKA